MIIGDLNDLKINSDHFNNELHIVIVCNTKEFDDRSLFYERKVLYRQRSAPNDKAELSQCL